MPRSTGRTWTPETTALLFDLTRTGKTQREIAQRLRRSPKAIERKAAKLKKAVSRLSFTEFVHAINTFSIATRIAGGKL
jgi:transcriptional regulator